MPTISRTSTALLIFRDSGELPHEAETALLDFVNGGRGLVAVHCASHTFRNSTSTRRWWEGGSRITSRAFPRGSSTPSIPLRGVKSFESWDETYVHDQLTDDRRAADGARSGGGL